MIKLKLKVFSVLAVLCCAFLFAACSSTPDTQIYKDYEYIVENGGVTITKYTGDEYNLKIPETINDTPVKVIGESAFQDNAYINYVTIPDSVTDIKEKAFFNCSNLKMADIVSPKSELLYVGYQSFGKTKVDFFTAPKNCRKVDNAFYGSLNCIFVMGKDTNIDSNVISTSTEIHADKDSVVAYQFSKDKGYNLIEFKE